MNCVFIVVHKYLRTANEIYILQSDAEKRRKELIEINGDDNEDWVVLPFECGKKFDADFAL